MPLLADVRAVPEHAADFGSVDVLTAGFPCQPFSVAGKSAGIDDPRNGWPWTLDAIRAVNPPEVFCENVPGLLSRSSRGYFGRILADLISAGYGVRWGVLSAAAVGAHHLRERLWIRGLRDWKPTPTGEVFGRVEGERLVSVNGGLFGAQDVVEFPSYGSAWGGQAWGGQAWGVEMHPTPRVSDITAGRTLDEDGYRISNGQRFGANLHDAAKAIHAAPTINGNHNHAGASAKSGDGLVTQIRQTHPTPRAEDSEKTGPHRGANDTLWSAVRNATPQARDDKGAPGAGCLARGGRASSLPAEIALHATQRAADYRSPLVSDEVFGKNARPLCEQAGKALHPTPTVKDREVSCVGDAESYRLRGVASNGAHGLSLSGVWTENYMGWPTNWTDPTKPVDLDGWPAFVENLWRTTRDSFTDWPWSPLDVPTKGLTRKRISALGDGQVPQCMAEAYRLLCR